MVIKEIRCPKCNKLLGKYDPAFGVRGVVYFCHNSCCKKEYTFNIPPQKTVDIKNKIF